MRINNIKSKIILKFKLKINSNMFNILDKFQSSFNKISQDEKEELESILSQVVKLTSKSRYDEALDLLRSKLNEFQNTCGLMFIENIKAEIVKVYNEYILSLINRPCSDSKNIQKIKKLFNECDYFIGNNINSYLLKQNNYVCFLNKNGHSKQAMKLLNKLQKIDILNYLNEEQEDKEKEKEKEEKKEKIKSKKIEKKSENALEIIAKDYSNISSLNKNSKNNYDALISAMESLTLTQFEKAFNDEEEKNKENLNKNLCLNYYLLGVQQEYLKRKNDSINSFASAKLYMPQIGKNKNNIEFNFIKKIHIPKSDANTCPINFRESLSSGS
jgi:hypothetical protein